MNAKLDIPALELRELVARYGEREAVRGVSLRIERGEFFGLLGPNGAGKTTLIGMICGIIEPSQGQILLNGQLAQPRTPALKRKLGLVPQEFAFYPTLSARDNLIFFGEMSGIRGAALKARMVDVLDIVRLTGREHEPVQYFSGGMKRRLNIAIGLLHEPEILVLDEPTVGVDAQSRGAILDCLERLNRGGVTIVYSTHTMEEAERLCGRVAIIDHGRIIALDTPQNLIGAVDQGMVQVEFSAPVTSLGLKQLKRLGRIQFLDRERRGIRFNTSKPEEDLQSLFEVARHLELPIGQLQLLQPNLETVFLKLTGRQLRD